MKFLNGLLFLSENTGVPEILGVGLLDGGRTTYYCELNGTQFMIRYVHYGSEELSYEKGYWPGGLYFDDYLVEVNSKEEKLINDTLKRLTINKKEYAHLIPEFQGKCGMIKNHGEALEDVIRSGIEFIGSPKYISLALKTGRLIEYDM
jgi:hypothetical protein